MKIKLQQEVNRYIFPNLCKWCYLSLFCLGGCVLEQLYVSYVHVDIFRLCTMCAMLKTLCTICGINFKNISKHPTLQYFRHIRETLFDYQLTSSRPNTPSSSHGGLKAGLGSCERVLSVRIPEDGMGSNVLIELLCPYFVYICLILSNCSFKQCTSTPPRHCN